MQQEMSAKSTQVAPAIIGNGGEVHPHAFHVSGPRNLSSPNWRDLINSSWKNGNYRRMVMACFIQGAYLLELDRQENRRDENALAPKWWLPFKFKLVETLTDERDGSIFGAVLEWDRAAAIADYILIRPPGAPSAVLALRGTILKSSTIKRDLQDDLRFLAWETLKGSVRFKVAFDAMKSVAIKYGSGNVCIAGHSLGAGRPSSWQSIGQRGNMHRGSFIQPAIGVDSHQLKEHWREGDVRLEEGQGMLPSGGEVTGTKNDESDMANMSLKKWVPHLYINNNDYICCYYTDLSSVNLAAASPKLFVLSKGNQKFLEAHKLDQWWADDLQLQSVISNSKLITQQLKSLYQMPTSHVVSPGMTMTAKMFTSPGRSDSVGVEIRTRN